MLMLPAEFDASLEDGGAVGVGRIDATGASASYMISNVDDKAWYSISSIVPRLPNVWPVSKRGHNFQRECQVQ